jgi:hypothetical protein
MKKGTGHGIHIVKTLHKDPYVLSFVKASCLKKGEEFRKASK